MRHGAKLLLCLLVPCSSVPSFDINLDEQPEYRWRYVVKYYRKELIGVLQKSGASLAEAFGDRLSTWDSIKFEPEYVRELQGIANFIGDPSATLQSLKYFNMLYEMQDPTACSGVLWVNQQNGTVLHGRNMDFVFNKSKYSRNVAWQQITYDAHLFKGGKKIMSMTQWPGIIGIHTAMRLSDGPNTNTGWSFEQNTRRPNFWRENLEAASRGGQIFSVTARRIMEDTPDYQTAVEKLSKASFAAPQYFVVSGSGPYEGSVLTIDRLSQHSIDSPPRQQVSNNEKAGWHLVQTNDDLLSKPKDNRRTLANFLLGNTQQIPSPDNMLSFMHTTMLLNMDTVFTTVMVPSYNYYRTVLPQEAPSVVDGMEMYNHINKDQGKQQAIAKMQAKQAAKMSQMWSGIQIDQNDSQNDTALDNDFLILKQRQEAFLATNRTSHLQVRRQRRFLAPHNHLPQKARDGQPALEDEMSFMQLSWQLESDRPADAAPREL